MKQSRAIQRSEYFDSTGYDNCVSQAGLLGDVQCPGCFTTIIFDIDDPDFLSCRHFSIGQQLFYNLELAALLLPNTNTYLINEIPDSRKMVVYDNMLASSSICQKKNDKS